MTTEDKALTRMGMMTITIVAGLYMLQVVQQILAPVEEEEEPEIPFGSPWLLSVGLIMNVSYQDEVPLYIGEAQPGTANSEAGWRIYRYELEMIAGDLEAVGFRFAGGTTKFDKVWDNRADYEYS